MKLSFYLFLFSLFISPTLSAQDTIIKRNGDSLKPQVYIKLADNSIYYYGKQFKYHNNIIGDTALQTILINTKDNDIVSCVHTMKRMRNLQLVGFGAIPFAVGALGCYRQIQKNKESSNSSPMQTIPISYDAENKRLLISASICFSLAIACPITATVFKQRKINYTHKAINLYNQKY